MGNLGQRPADVGLSSPLSIATSKRSSKQRRCLEERFAVAGADFKPAIHVVRMLGTEGKREVLCSSGVLLNSSAHVYGAPLGLRKYQLVTSWGTGCSIQKAKMHKFVKQAQEGLFNQFSVGTKSQLPTFCLLSLRHHSLLSFVLT